MPLLKLEDAKAVGQGGTDGSPPREGGCDGGEGHVRSCLWLLADGDATNSWVCHLALWESSGRAKKAGGSAEICLPFELLLQDGFIMHPPLTFCKADGFELLRQEKFIIQPLLALAQDMVRLAKVMEQLKSAGWPPMFCFKHNAVWDFVAAQVWPIMCALLGMDCVLNSGSAFTWSLKVAGKSNFPPDGKFRSWQNTVSSINTIVPKEKEHKGHHSFGSSFGLSHGNYSTTNLLYCKEKEEEEGKGCPKAAASNHPAILNVSGNPSTMPLSIMDACTLCPESLTFQHLTIHSKPRLPGF
jgi:hypothetical protein